MQTSVLNSRIDVHESYGQAAVNSLRLVKGSLSMAKHLHDDLMTTLQGNAGFSPQVVDSLLKRADYTDWLKYVDITSYDYPYITPLLLKTYEEWSKELPLLPGTGGVVWFVADYAGKMLLRQDMEMADQIATDCANRQEAACTFFEDSHYLAVPLLSRHTKELIAVLGCRIDRLEQECQPLALSWVEMSGRFFLSCFYKAFEALFVSDVLNLQQKSRQEEHRRTILFQVVQKLHDQIDVDAVLTEVFERISGMYPGAEVELLMSQDYLSRDPRVKSLRLQGEDGHMCVQAFMQGKMIQNEYLNELQQSCLEIAVPLTGKQGVYGVFHLAVQKSDIEEADLLLIEMLADTAGSAFENAKLYEQSNLLVSELRLINELTKRLNESLRLKEVFNFATEELLSIFHAEYCCICQLDKDSEFFEVMACNVPELSQEYFSKDYGFSGVVCATREPMILSDYMTYGKVQSRLMEDTGSRSLMVAPLIVRGEVIGTIMLAHRMEHFFSYENYRLLQVLSSHIGLSIANASLHAEVQRMANQDMLTELYARRYLDDRVSEMLKLDEKGCLIIVDIDSFKQINDTYGHQVGDRILKQVCAIIRSAVRKSDISARWGGEELAIYLPGADVQCGHQIAETVRMRVAAETHPQVTVSCGISGWTLESEKVSVESLFYIADMALYKAKKSGRNQSRVG